MVSITLDGGLMNGWFGLWPLAADVLTGQIVGNYLLEIICSIFLWAVVRPLAFSWVGLWPLVASSLFIVILI